MKKIIMFVSVFIIVSCASSPTPQTRSIISGLSCSEILNSGKSAQDGIYIIDPDGTGGSAPFKAYCDMSHEGGGWMMFAHHSDGIAKIKTLDLVDKNNFGVLQNERWRVVLNKMTTGLMIIDENGLVSTISAAKLRSGNCVTIQSVANLTQPKLRSGGIWHHENSGCEATGGDYSLIQLAGNDYSEYQVAGAALQQDSTFKFDKWPYSRDWSFQNQNTLLYFIK